MCHCFDCCYICQTMYTLLSGLWKYTFQKDEYNVLILGLDNAGKTVSWTKLVFPECNIYWRKLHVKIRRKKSLQNMVYINLYCSHLWYHCLKVFFLFNICIKHKFYSNLSDIPGANKDEVHKELSRHESEQNHNYSGTKQ